MFEQLGTIKAYNADCMQIQIKSVKVETMYGDYIRDRRAEMFNIIPMVGESRRK